MPTNQDLRHDGFKMPPVNDAPRLCVKMTIPNDPDFIYNLIGALEPLTWWFSYRGEDPTRRKRLIAATMRDIWEHIEFEQCPQPVTAPAIGADGEENLLRQNPDNPCLLETSIDGTHWCAFADLSLCKPGPGQPGAGAEQPRPGGCATYSGDMQAPYTWLLPTNVNENDTIEVIGFTGAWTDGNALGQWRCPDGSLYVAGVCVGALLYDSLDPLPASPHMTLLALIDGVYYDAMRGPITVPSGVSNAQVTFLANDELRSDNSGAIGFDVKVCNNQAAPGVDIVYTETDGGTVLASGPARVNYGQTFTITSITSGFAIFARFNIAAKMTILGSSNYVEFSPSSANFDYAYWDSSNTRHNLTTDTHGPFPSDWNPTVPVRGFGAVSDVSSAWSVTVRLDPA